MAGTRGRKLRPYWHVDAKWIAGLILTCILSVALSVYGLVQATERKTAVDALGLTLAVAFSQKGLDDESEIAEFRQRFRNNPNGAIQPIPGLRLTIRENEIANLSPRAARLTFMRKLAEPVYDDGAQGLADLADDAEMRQSITAGGGALNVLTRKTHESLQGALRLLAVVCAFLFVLLIFFSDRFGRLGSAGCMLFAASLPWAVVSGVLATTSQATLGTAPPTEQGTFAMVNYMASFIIPPLAQAIAPTYLAVLLLGVALMLIAVLGHVAWSLAHRSRAT